MGVAILEGEPETPMLLLLLSSAWAAPPSTTLSGPAGLLSWQVQERADSVLITGRSPKWTVEHVAAPDLTPRSTTRTDAEGTRVVVTYDAAGASVTRDGRTTRIDAPGVWDGDTVDVRLGALAATGGGTLEFQVVDAAGAKLYDLDAVRVGAETCGTLPCTHVRVQLDGLLRYVGPTWEYWYASDGRLLRFTGPIGAFAAPGAQ